MSNLKFLFAGACLGLALSILGLSWGWKYVMVIILLNLWLFTVASEL